MPLEFEYHPDAIAEASAAFEWYAEQSEPAAERFWAELVRARTLATQAPQTWSPYLYNTRCFHLKRFPYGLVYIQRGDRIIGIAVAHFKRKPGYWRDRLDS